MNYTVSFFLGLLLLLTSCLSQEKTHRPLIHEIGGQIFGSTYSIKYLGDLPPQDFKPELDLFFKEFNNEFSTYQKKSTISLLNEANVNQKVSVKPRFIEMLKLANSLQEITEGAFDPTLGPVIKAWGFSGGGIPKSPGHKELSLALADMGLKNIKWDEKNLTVWKIKKGVSLNLNAFAPGWAADLIGADLDKKNIKNYMVDVGGEILVKGKKGEAGPWVIGIEEPSQELGHVIRTALKISDLSIATSGDYRQFFNDKGHRKSHIIDPRTGYPVANKISSVTVLAPSAVLADTWGTALMVMGEKGLEKAEKNGIKVMMLRAEGPDKFTVLYSSGMKEYLEKNQL